MKRFFYAISILVFLFSFTFTDWKNPSNTTRPNKDFALFFAVQNYDEWGDLRNPIKDAKAIAADLEQNYGFQTEVVENPTLAQIGQKLEAYRQKAYAEDAQLLIFFSGHGEFNESTKEGFFIPKEGRTSDPFQTTYLAHSRLERAVTTIPCRHILLAIDACYSGTFDDAIALDRGRLGQRPGEVTKSEQQRFIERVLAYQSRFYLTSGGKERTPDGQEHSPFTLQFLAALRTFGGANQILDFDELKSFMKEANPRPHAGQFEGHEPGGDFLFVVEDGNAISQPTPPREQPAKEDTREVTLEGGESANPNDPGIPTQGPILKAQLPQDPSGRTYKTVEINGKTWLQENLDYDVGYGSWCYEDKKENCEQYGRLYDWEAAQKACKDLGDGWRLPTDEEWGGLAEYLGGYKNYENGAEIGKPARAYQNFLNDDEQGIAMRLGGLRHPNRKNAELGQTGNYWTATPYQSSQAWFFYLSTSSGRMNRNKYTQSYGFSCRCVKGE